MLKKYKEVLGELEKKKGGPVVVYELRKYIVNNKIPEFSSIGYDDLILRFLAYRQMPDEIYLNSEASHTSLIKWNDDYKTYNEWTGEWKAKGFEFDHLQRMRAGTTRTVDFDLLFKVLSSKDEQLLKDNAWMFENCTNIPRFLTPADKSTSGKTVESTGNHVAYVTFPRVGNTFMRKILQNVTGIFTGADNPLEYVIDLQLKSLAEEITDDTVWVKKSHFPMVPPYSVVHKSNKAVVCVRNPYDAFASFMNLFFHQCHSGTINEKFQDVKHVWSPMLEYLIRLMKLAHEQMLKIAKIIPVYFVRYEDLCNN
jgi:hypothetical protein